MCDNKITSQQLFDRGYILQLVGRVRDRFPWSRYVNFEYFISKRVLSELQSGTSFHLIPGVYLPDIAPLKFRQMPISVPSHAQLRPDTNEMCR